MCRLSKKEWKIIEEVKSINEEILNRRYNKSLVPV